MRHNRPISHFFFILRSARILIFLATAAVIWIGVSSTHQGPDSASEAAPETPGPTPETAPDPAPEDPEKPPNAQPAEPNVIPLGGDRFKIGTIEFDKAKRTITIPASVLMREGAVEYLLVTRTGKVHESVFVTDADPQDIHLAALLLGIRPSADLGPADSSMTVPPTAALQASVTWDRNGPPQTIHLHEALAIAPAGETSPSGPAPATLWLYNGSRIQQDGTFVARREGSIISVIRDPEALINYPGDTRDNDEIHLPNAAALPKLEHPVRIVLKLR
ncbi:YdjY domain-containing protein [Haloferula rosea]|uniref:Uncharacterized protein n=1 Tax=Haloferula rosea TaxID=490093 RepID=A0A934VGS0_9BACT|nr:YdjY domain-containing protein [Haloferula rosea]MBK1828332.1 hypothetical protein [Haloferula rosea]